MKNKKSKNISCEKENRFRVRLTNTQKQDKTKQTENCLSFGVSLCSLVWWFYPLFGGLWGCYVSSLSAIHHEVTNRQNNNTHQSDP